MPFNQSFRPGPKKFDFDINQISYLPARAEAVDFSDSYYDVEQAIVTLEGSKIANAASVADLRDAKLGAQIGTTSLEVINDTIQPGSEPSVYAPKRRDLRAEGEADRRDRRRLPDGALHGRCAAGHGKVVGRLAADGSEYFGVVLEKDSSLTECVNEAIQKIKDDGTLDSLEQKWLAAAPRSRVAEAAAPAFSAVAAPGEARSSPSPARSRSSASSSCWSPARRAGRRSRAVFDWEIFRNRFETSRRSSWSTSGSS